MTDTLRKPAVAGSFYPADPKKLDLVLSDLISQSKKIKLSGRIKILIVPHAGIAYSGPTAAAGFKQIEGQNYTRVIILGASHQAWFDYAAVFNQGVWETPLGIIEIDESLAKKIIDKNTNIIADTKLHLAEHSLEVELIFLQKVLKNFKIVPILLSQTSDQLIANLAQKIAQNLDKKTLLVVSSDLSHYPPYEIANQVDKNTIETIISGKFKSIDYPGVQTTACGAEAIRVALKVAEIKKIKFAKIKYQNSGDPPVGGPAGDKNRVVGYAAIIGTSQN